MANNNSDQFGNLTGGEPAPTPMLPQTLNGNPAQALTGSFANPNGNVTPAVTTQAAFYTQDSSNPVNMYAWSVSKQSWFPVVS